MPKSGQQELVVGFVGAGGLAEQVQQLLYRQVFLLLAPNVHHNMRDAIAYGNRLVMMYDGRIVVDVSGEEKKHLTVEQLLNLFSQASGSDEADDKLLLS